MVLIYLIQEQKKNLSIYLTLHLPQWRGRAHSLSGYSYFIFFACALLLISSLPNFSTSIWEGHRTESDTEEFLSGNVADIMHPENV